MYTTIANNVSDVNDVNVVGNVVGNVSIVKYLDLPKKNVMQQCLVFYFKVSNWRFSALGVVSVSNYSM